MEIINMFKIMFVVIFFFGGLGYLFYIKSRKKKMKWKAYIYQLGEGTREEHYKDRDGNILKNLKLKDLKPYGKDVLVQEELEHGINVFTLKRLGITTKEVTADMVQVWGKEKIVHVLLVGNTATIMTSGYDKEYGKEVFRPEPRDKSETMISNMALRKERYEKEKDILTAISPWIIALIVCGTLLGCVYIGGESFTKISDNILKSSENIAAMQLEVTRIMNESIQDNIKLIQDGERDRILRQLSNMSQSNIPSIE